MSDARRAPVVRVVHGLYGIADSSCGDPVMLGQAMLEGGCRLLQLRAKDWDPAEVETAARQLLAACDHAGATFVVNDDAALAARIGAPALHLGQTDGSLVEARQRFDAPVILGRSTHSVDQALEAVVEGADYVAFGPCFDTPRLSRPKPVRGLALLAEVRAALPAHIPLVAIGGIRPDRLAAVRAAGADSWAVIGAICNAPDPVAATRLLSLASPEVR